MGVQTVKIDQLADAIMDGLEEYKNLAGSQVKSAVRKAANTVRDDIKATAPRRTGRYAESWTTSKTKENSTGLTMTVYSPSRYMLAHLLEFGHALRNGGRARAFPHIAPAEEHGVSVLESAITKALEG